MCKSSNRLFTQPEAQGEVTHKALRAWLFENRTIPSVVVAREGGRSNIPAKAQ
jgi:hypothetical protein